MSMRMGPQTIAVSVIAKCDNPQVGGGVVLTDMTSHHVSLTTSTLLYAIATILELVEKGYLLGRLLANEAKVIAEIIDLAWFRQRAGIRQIGAHLHLLVPLLYFLYIGRTLFPYLPNLNLLNLVYRLDLPCASFRAKFITLLIKFLDVYCLSCVQEGQILCRFAR